MVQRPFDEECTNAENEAQQWEGTVWTEKRTHSGNRRTNQLPREGTRRGGHEREAGDHVIESATEESSGEGDDMHLELAGESEDHCQNKTA